MHPFDKCCGIELLPSLHDAALTVQERYVHAWPRIASDAGGSEDGSEGGSEGSAAADPGAEERAQRTSFICGDFLIADWSDADVVFANSTCFDDALMAVNVAIIIYFLSSPPTITPSCVL